MLKSLLQFEPVLVRLCNNKQWDEASRRAHSHPNEAVPSSQAHRSTTALSAAVRGGAPLETVVCILEACPQQLFVCHLRRGSILHDAILHNRHKHTHRSSGQSYFDVLRFLVSKSIEFLKLTSTSLDNCDVSQIDEYGGHNGGEVNPFAMFDCLGRRPLHLVVSKACMGMDMDLVSMFVRAYPGAAACRDGDSQTPLTTALSITSEVGNMEIEMRVLEVSKLLLQAYPAAATQGISSGRSASLMTPLWCAIYYGRFSSTVKLLLEANPNGVQDVCMNHEVCLNLCVTTRVPLDIIRMILTLHPEAALVQDNYTLTPLCWAWIRHISPSRRSSMRLFITSQFPTLLEDAIRDFECMKVSHTGQVLGIANGEKLDYFWSTAQMLLCAGHHSNTLDNILSPSSKIQWRALHAASALCCPSPFFLLSYKLHPEQVRQRDESGKIPLHHAAARASYRREIPIGATSLRSFELTDHLSPLSVLLDDYPEGAAVTDNEGRLPLHIWVENLCGGCERTNSDDLDARLHELELLMEANIYALERRDVKTHIYPFMLALISPGELSLSSVNFAFLMLKMNPSLIKNER